MYLSESEIAGDLFYMELGNLPARTAAKLSFSYVQELDLSHDKIGTFMLPTVINPRYMPEYSKIISILVACHWSRSFQRKSKAQLKFTLGLLCFRSICELYYSVSTFPCGSLAVSGGDWHFLRTPWKHHRRNIN